jgi:GTP diphosphokinase / guanosine-3',5'-bis(diphosphate) 3'-diphosphatase
MSDLIKIFTVLAFAAEKHRNQRRKDSAATPYVNHVIGVATVLAAEGGVTDETLLLAAVLHDTVEDTYTTFDELEHHFGRAVRDFVAEVTDDKALPKDARKELQVTHAAAASRGAKQLKIADKICNVRDIAGAPPAGWSLERKLAYFDWAERVVAACRGVNAGLDEAFDRALQAARGTVGA